MGVPDILKFVSSLSQEALCRIPGGKNAASLCVDYVLVDATNALHTIGLDSLATFLQRRSVCVQRAVIFALDAQRDRSGTTREHRTHSTVLDADVAVRQLCVRLQEHYKKCEGTRAPLVCVSGRQVAGEADYKVLDIQRRIIADAIANGNGTVPTFCFVSEDSDVLCGAICGPSPQNVYVVTKLHDVMMDLCLLRLSYVLKQIASCVEALGSLGDAWEAREIRGTGAFLSGTSVHPPDAHCSEEEVGGGERNEDVVRRKKKDGPLVFTGKRVMLSDSESDAGEEIAGVERVPVADGKGDRENHGNHCRGVEEIAPHSFMTTPGDAAGQYDAVAEILQNSCVDLVFLFIVVMGNGGNIPPLVRGATKVDIRSCWQKYCRIKYKLRENEGEKDFGRTLIDLSDTVRKNAQVSDGVVTISVNCAFLYDVLELAQYADTQSRSPSDEDVERALLFLTKAVYAILRYIVACNFHVDATMTASETFLDARSLVDSESTLPGLDAFLFMLRQVRRRVFSFPLTGTATGSVMANAPLGAAKVEAAMAKSKPSLRNPQQRIVLDVDVCNTLTTFEQASGTSRPVPFHRLLWRPGPDMSERMKVIPCVSQCLKRYMTNSTAIRDGAKLSSFAQMIVAWKETLKVCIPNLIGAGDQRSAFVCGANKGAKASASDQAVNQQPSHQGGVKLSYSFELRRMAPVLGSNNSSHGDTLRVDSEHRAAMLRALRVSYDYTHQTSSNVSTGYIAAEEKLLLNNDVEPKKPSKKQLTVDGPKRLRKHSEIAPGAPHTKRRLSPTSVSLAGEHAQVHASEGKRRKLRNKPV
ncbi:hypothetical protein ERJ75_000974700 [Trypanosoma vivax]|uniref:Uncharacterized protein n=1 Tax=Trypanosoma vivax (strain Y486) TaxID=1055687 RepID=G0U6N1_TRYVY|nr:hypothetical protein ERJ75_000974700 [Trypanosoma vivax]CCC51535.1 conserved hypothetical protein [Trypanosoma vivax Y486]